jgi:hypothetical protein
MELDLGTRQEHDLQLALLALGKSWTGDMDLQAVGGCVLDSERAFAANLEAIMENGIGSELVGAKAGAGVVHFKKLNGCAGAIFDGRIDVVGMAGGDKESSEADCEKEASSADGARQSPDSSMGGVTWAAEGGSVPCFVTSFSSRSRRLRSSGRR